MTRAEMVAALHAIERTVDDRVHVWRVVIDAQGRETGQKFYRGSFQQPRDPQNREPHHSGG